MRPKPAWPPYLQPLPVTELSLPPRPGIKRPIFADTCPKCRCLHTSLAAVQACQQMVASREQQ